MDEDFEKAKQLVIEGFEETLKLYFPYLKICDGLRMLGISDVINDDKRDDDKLIEIAIDTLRSSLRSAKTADEIRQSIMSNTEFWRVVIPDVKERKD